MFLKIVHVFYLSNILSCILNRFLLFDHEISLKSAWFIEEDVNIVTVKELYRAFRHFHNHGYCFYFFENLKPVLGLFPTIPQKKCYQLQQIPTSKTPIKDWKLHTFFFRVLWTVCSSTLGYSLLLMKKFMFGSVSLTKPYLLGGHFLLIFINPFHFINVNKFTTAFTILFIIGFNELITFITNIV